MPISRDDLNKDMSDDWISERKVLLESCISNDEWATRVFKKIAILVVSHSGQRAYLNSCIETHSKLGYFIALAYDNYIDPEISSIDHNSFMPDKDILDKIDLLIIPHHQTWKDDMYPWFWQLKWGSSALQNFEYIYCVNGDFIIEKPDSFNELFSLLEGYDIMTCGPDTEKESSTGAFISKSQVLIDIVGYIQNYYIPFEKYEKNKPYTSNAETRFGEAIKSLSIKQKHVDIYPDSVLLFEPKGTWYDLVGLRHIHGELDYAYKLGLIPPHYKYIEEKYLLDVYNYELIKEYWDTGNIGVLDSWWRK